VIKGKSILIFGGTGSLGQALIRRLSESNHLILFSRDEAKHWTIRNQLTSNQNISFAVGDIRDKNRVSECLRIFNPDIVIIAAALKQVDTCELSPFESIQTNVLGINNVIQCTLEMETQLPSLESVLLVSTDKACAPTNVYGMCKAISERLITSSMKSSKRVRYLGVRYGNVLESRGSIIPLFKYQVIHGSSLTVTDLDMTRFIMTLDESIDLIGAALSDGESGEIWLPKIRSMRIRDLAEIFAKKYKKKIEVIGIRPGEKLHEDLISQTESLRIRYEDPYFKMVPSFTKNISTTAFSYSSADDLLTIQELEDFLNSLNIFEENLDDLVGLRIEEIRTGELD
jgi:UDP-glucose 4-epimerase